MFCGLLAGLCRGARRRTEWRPQSLAEGCGAAVEWVLAELRHDPGVKGEVLARRLGISAGHLARSFKQQTGVSLVAYRNRLRLDRFFDNVGSGANLLESALDAGFGSYAQFHRIYRQVFGSSPREHLVRSGSARPASGAWPGSRN